MARPGAVLGEAHAELVAVVADFGLFAPDGTPGLVDVAAVGFGDSEAVGHVGHAAEHEAEARGGEDDV